MEDEIDLRDYFKVIKKRIAGIIIIFIVAVVAAGVFSFTMPKIYQIDTTLEIGQVGKEMLEAPAQMIEKIEGNVWAIENMPKMEAKNPTGTNLIKITAETSDSEKAKGVLEELNRLILAEHEEKIRVKKELVEKDIEAINNKITTTKKDIEGTENKIKSLDNDIARTQNKIKPIENDIARIRNKITYAEEEKENLEDKIEALEQTLVYEQTPGTQFALFDTKEKLAGKKQEIENLYLSINSLQRSIEDLNLQVNALNRNKEDLNTQINSLRNGIEDFNSKIGALQASLDNIQSTKVVKAPTVSDSPIKPRPLLNIAIAAVLGLFVGVLWAFAAEYLREEKKGI